MKPKPPPTYQQTTYYGRHHHHQQQQQQTIPERTLWSYIIQIASAIKKVHERGQAVRMIDVTKILVTGQNRVRISSCSIFDILLYGAQQDVTYFQHEDLQKFGKLVFALCTKQHVGCEPGQLAEERRFDEEGLFIGCAGFCLVFMQRSIRCLRCCARGSCRNTMKALMGLIVSKMNLWASWRMRDCSG
ncbi:hypothetical protein CPB84DRAFT_1057055 [Gymnopilus junonius]|uniref:Protein kinase domain-containing protein n=1 Tax=Gymnopilus junonius TaxID=109634 RepID=A0A9P5NMI2_GYMJU|nr:hypothetical protein CPB84DRAFT_1057055 [Gymnopilus junonius]